MKDSLPTTLALCGGLLIVSGLVGWLLWRDRNDVPAPAHPAPITADAESGGQPSAQVTTAANPGEFALSATANNRLKSLLQQRLGQKDARAHEAVLTFQTEEAYRRFLARAGKTGLRLRGQPDALRTVRVDYASIDQLYAELTGNPADYQGVEANYLVHLPETPAPEDRPKVSQVALGNHTLAFLGVAGDHSEWGRGETIAVLDTGVAPDVTVSGRVRYLDLGLGALPGAGTEDGHGTAVAGLAAGAALDAPGVAPAASLLSIRVTGPDGTGDSFTLAQGILAAVDSGAAVINVSMGSYTATDTLAQAIDYASSRGVLIVASAGNDGAAQLTWPAADPRVISVGAVDALEQQVYFSNSGAQLKITAPGYGVDAAWLNGTRVSFDGTSASAPLVAGAIVAVMSTNPGLTAGQAWSILQQYASDGGVPGPDSDYGSGILNLGWAMNRNDSSRFDTAIAGQYYDAATNTMNVVVQNRGGQTASGLQLTVTINGSATSQFVPPLNPGATALQQIAVSSDQAAAVGGLVVRTRLENPAGTIDQEPGNNAKAGVILPPVK